MGIDFNDACWTSDWIVKWNNRRCTFQLSAPFGEQLEAIEMDGTTFSYHQSQLVGMNQVRRKLKKWMESFTARDLYKICNCRQVQGLKVQIYLKYDERDFKYFSGASRLKLYPKRV